VLCTLQQLAVAEICTKNSKRKIVFSILQQLAAAEKQYLAAGFLQPRGFLRKDVSVSLILNYFSGNIFVPLLFNF